MTYHLSTKGYRTCNLCHEMSVAPEVVPAENLDGSLVLVCPDCHRQCVIDRVEFLKGRLE